MAIVDIGLPDRMGDVLVSEFRVVFLDKPYTQDGLLAAVRSLL